MGTYATTALITILGISLAIAEDDDDLVILTPDKPSAQYDTANILLPGDSFFLEADGTNKLSATVQISEQGRAYLPFLKNNSLILGYLTIPEVISQIKTALKDEGGDYVIAVKKLARQQAAEGEEDTAP